MFKYLGAARSAEDRRGDGRAEERDRASRSATCCGEFCAQAEQHTGTVGLDSDDYIRTVLTKALGDDKAGALIDRILQGSDTSGIEGLKWMDSAAVAELIKNEHPQIIATILVHLDRDQASEILALLHRAPAQRRAAAHRHARRHPAGGAARAERRADQAPLGQRQPQEQRRWAASRTAAEILNFMPATQEDGGHRRTSRTTTPTSRRRSSTRCSCSRTCSTSTTAASSCCCRKCSPSRSSSRSRARSPELREKIFKNMSQRAAETLARRPRVRRPGARVRSRGAAEGDPADRAPPGRRRPDRARRQGRGCVCLITSSARRRTALGLPALGDGLVRSGAAERRAGRAAPALEADLRTLRDAAHAQGIASRPRRRPGDRLSGRLRRRPCARASSKAAAKRWPKPRGSPRWPTRSRPRCDGRARQRARETLRRRSRSTSRSRWCASTSQRDPTALIAAGARGAGRRARAGRRAALIVHPDDLPVVEAYLSEELQTRGWTRAHRSGGRTRRLPRASRHRRSRREHRHALGARGCRARQVSHGEARKIAPAT